MAKRSSDIVQVKVRMRADMHRQLAKEAERRGQTLNAEILNRLERSFGPEDIAATIQQTAEATVNQVAERVLDSPRRQIEMKYRDLERNLRRNLPFDQVFKEVWALYAAEAKEMEDAATKLILEQKPSLDEHAAREHVNWLLKQLELPPPRAEEKRRRDISDLLRFLENAPSGALLWMMAQEPK
jgi:hypothetical protein